ncbi:MAG TPA: hypothetical protein VFK89_01115, partial [Actinomycetota bacterium]|nr:hypothetical protein [Actinomycetota bacterium]
ERYRRAGSSSLYFDNRGPMKAMSIDMGLGAGGRMRQKIYEDEIGIDSWDFDNPTRVFVHIANSMVWRDITGEEPPATPVSASLYSEHGLPWFDLYDEHKSDIAGGRRPR